MADQKKAVESTERNLLPSSELPENAAVKMVIVGRRRFVQWEGCPALHVAPNWVWQLVSDAEKSGRQNPIVLAAAETVTTQKQNE